MNLNELLPLIRPGEKWSLRGSTLDDLEWLDVTLKPTQEEIDTALSQATSLNYKRLRRVTYPPIEDQLDALWKGGQAEIDMKAVIQSVKDLYPKP